MEDSTTDELGVKVAKTDSTLRSLADSGESLRYEVVEFYPLGQPIPKVLGLGAQLLIGDALGKAMVDLRR